MHTIVTPNDLLDVSIQDQTSPLVNLYAYRTDATPTLTSDPAVDDVTLDINTNAGMTDGDAITLLEDDMFFQSIVKSTTATTVTMNSGLDKDFSADAAIEVGPWNMNVDGSGVVERFSVKPPPNLNFDIYTVGITITDNAAMDSAKFGGIAALSNGFVIRSENGVSQNLLLAVNNLGFAEQGFELTYDPKAPAGVYGLRAELNLHIRNGIANRLFGELGDVISALIQDDLTGLTQITMVVGGHVVVD